MAVVSNERRNRRKKKSSRASADRESNGSINVGDEGRVMVCPAAPDSEDTEGAVGGTSGVHRGYGTIDGTPPQGAIGGVAHPLMDVVENHFSKGKDNQNFEPDDDDLPEVQIVSRSQNRKKKRKRKRENDA